MVIQCLSIIPIKKKITVTDWNQSVTVIFFCIVTEVRISLTDIVINTALKSDCFSVNNTLTPI